MDWRGAVPGGLPPSRYPRRSAAVSARRAAASSSAAAASGAALSSSSSATISSTCAEWCWAGAHLAFLHQLMRVMLGWVVVVVVHAGATGPWTRQTERLFNGVVSLATLIKRRQKRQLCQRCHEPARHGGQGVRAAARLPGRRCTGRCKVRRKGAAHALFRILGCAPFSNSRRAHIPKYGKLGNLL